jgi:DNA-binding winged helix-turn-helix (wHTH) protein
MTGSSFCDDRTMTAPADRLVVGDWRAHRLSGRIDRPGETRRLEPKVIDLLFLLASRRGEVFTREELFSRLWPGLTVGDDALARCVLKLRRALGDDPARPRYVETIARRGYRLLDPPASTAQRSRRLRVAALAAAAMAALAFAIMPFARPAPAAATDILLERADDNYFQFTLAENRAAAQLYRRVLAADPDNARALAGLSSAIVQSLLRWPRGRETGFKGSPLRRKLASGSRWTVEEQARLDRALFFARRAAALEPDDSGHVRALGIALSAAGKTEEALRLYERAAAAEPDSWAIEINRADLLDLKGEPLAAVAALERGYEAMSRVYPREAARVRPWQPALGVEIAGRRAALGDGSGALRWYRRTLADSPAFAPARDELRRLEAGRPAHG